MMHFTVEDYTAVNANCVKCCCEKLKLKPGTVTKVSVGYAPWAVPIGQLHCAPQFQLEMMETCPPPVGSNMPPQATAEVKFSTAMNALLENTLTAMITDPEAAALTFKALPLYGAKHGKLDVKPDGTFSYMPAPNFKGEERFYISASDGTNTAIFEVMIAVGIDPAAMIATPHVSVGAAVVDQRYFTVYFPVIVTPAAAECEVWRLTVLQSALDCECICFTRSDCFDIGIGKC
jgi:Bacterial Ig domain